jgi:hypothetical protein
MAWAFFCRTGDRLRASTAPTCQAGRARHSLVPPLAGQILTPNRPTLARHFHNYRPSAPPCQSSMAEDEDPAWPEWANGNAYTPFTELMALRRVVDEAENKGRWTFLSRSPAYSPGGFTRAFGGHVYAQAGLAAARTVRAGMVLHVRFLSPYPLSHTHIHTLSFVILVFSGWGEADLQAEHDGPLPPRRAHRRAVPVQG